jgi:hypothetical protein
MTKNALQKIHFLTQNSPTASKNAKKRGILKRRMRFSNGKLSIINYKLNVFMPF